MRLLILFLSLPWWLYFPMAGGIAWFAYDWQAKGSLDAANYMVAIEEQPPAVTDMLSGQRPATGTVPEVVLRAQIDTDLTTELVKRTNGVVTSRHIMYALVATDAPETPREIEATIILPMSQRDALVEFLVENTRGFGKVGPIVEIAGLIEHTNLKSSHARDALADQGHTLASGDYFIAPFLNGREAGLSDAASDQTESAFVLFLIAIGVTAIGLAKFAMVRVGRRETAPRLTPQEAEQVLSQPAAAPQPGEYAVLSPEEEAALTPLQRIKRRQALAAGAAPSHAGAVPDPAPVEPQRPAPAPTGFGLRRRTATQTGRNDGFDAGPIQSARRRGRKSDPFDRLAEQAGRS